MPNYSNQIHTKMTNVHNKLIHPINKLTENFELELPLVNVCIAFNKLILKARFLTSHRILIIFSVYTQSELKTVTLLDLVKHRLRHAAIVYLSRTTIYRRLTKQTTIDR